MSIAPPSYLILRHRVSLIFHAVSLNNVLPDSSLYLDKDNYICIIILHNCMSGILIHIPVLIMFLVS